MADPFRRHENDASRTQSLAQAVAKAAEQQRLFDRDPRVAAFPGGMAWPGGIWAKPAAPRPQGYFSRQRRKA
jgi:hypothetical protein